MPALSPSLFSTLVGDKLRESLLNFRTLHMGFHAPPNLSLLHPLADPRAPATFYFNPGASTMHPKKPRRPHVLDAEKESKNSALARLSNEVANLSRDLENLQSRHRELEESYNALVKRNSELQEKLRFLDTQFSWHKSLITILASALEGFSKGRS